MFEEIKEKTPELTCLPQYDPRWEKGTARIRAVMYDGVELEHRKTKVFAYLAFPEDVSVPVPAVVLVHGGGCHPDCEWIEEWTSRGYAVIAPDTTGHFPGEPHTLFTESDRGNWQHALPEDIFDGDNTAVQMSDRYTAAPDNSEMKDTKLPTEDRWIYHAVAQVILAHNLLKAEKRIDRDKIGICGISWGGVITSIVIGHDPGYAFAIPIYGSAYQAEGVSDLDVPFRQKENEEWLAEKHYDRVNMPVLWLCWNDDCCFSVNSNSDSYLRTVQNQEDTVLSMRHLMMHSHTAGFRCRESYWFADCVVNRKKIAHVRAEVSDGKLFFTCDDRVQRIRFFYLTEKMTYGKREKYGTESSFMMQEWKILELSEKEEALRIPEDAAEYYLEVTLNNDIVLCSRLFRK